MATKPIAAVVKLHIAAGGATPAPPVGPALAAHGLNIGEFCQRFNDETREKQGFTIPVEVTIYEDRTYDYILHQPPASELLKKIAGVEKGSGEPNRKKVGSISKSQLEEVAKQKMDDLNANDIAAAMKIIEGTAKNMGITVD